MKKRDLKAYVRFDGTGKVVAGSLVFRSKKPSGKFKELINPSAYECCNTTTTTTTSTTTTSTTTTTTTTLP